LAHFAVKTNLPVSGFCSAFSRLPALVVSKTWHIPARYSLGLFTALTRGNSVSLYTTPGKLFYKQGYHIILLHFVEKQLQATVKQRYRIAGNSINIFFVYSFSNT